MKSELNQEALKETVLDKYTKVCTCRVISRATIKKAIADGAKAVEEVSKATGACTGSCKGMRCKHIIEKLLKEYQ